DTKLYFHVFLLSLAYSVHRTKAELFSLPGRAAPLSECQESIEPLQVFQVVTVDMGGARKASKQIDMPRARSLRRGPRLKQQARTTHQEITPPAKGGGAPPTYTTATG